MDSTLIKLISDNEREKALKSHSELFLNCNRYKEIEKQLKSLTEEKDTLKEKILLMSENIMEEKSAATTTAKEGKWIIESCKRRNIKIKNKNGFINFCKNAGLQELIVTTQDIDKKKYYQKFEQGCIPMEIAEAFTEIDFSVTLKIEEDII